MYCGGVETALPDNQKGASTLPWIGANAADECLIDSNLIGERVYNPVGDTDSEAVFCSMLNALRAKFDHLPTMSVLYEEIGKLAEEIVAYDKTNSIFNFLLACGEHVQFAYSWPGARPGSKVWNGLYYTIREPPFQMVQLTDCDSRIDFSEFCCDDDRVAVVATAPLTKDEVWIEVQRGQLVLFDEGRPHMAKEQCRNCDDIGHGLSSKVLTKQLHSQHDPVPNKSSQPQRQTISNLALDSRHTLTVHAGESI